MKAKAIYYILFLALCSCKGTEDANLIYSNANDYYSIEVFTIKNKIDENGIAQCSKYATRTVNDSIFESYGMSLTKELAYSLKTTKKYLKTNDAESLKMPYLKIKIKNLINAPLNYDSIINLVLVESFDLTIVSTSKTVHGYKLNITDPFKLIDYQAECGTSSVKYGDGVFSATAITFNGISKIVDQHVQEYIFFRNDHERCYSIDFIVSDDMNKMNDKLEQYGVRFEKEAYEQTFYEIKTAANKKQMQVGFNLAPAGAFRLTEKHFVFLQHHGRSRPSFIQTVESHFDNLNAMHPAHSSPRETGILRLCATI